MICRFEVIDYIVRQPRLLLEKNPTILFLHGAGSRGDDPRLLEENAFLRSPYICGEASPFLVFAPQCRENTWFDVFEQLKAFVSVIRADPHVDSERIYLMGNSMGGYGAWQLAMSLPGVFAALVPICGGGMSWNAVRIAHPPVWAFHGKEDTVVPPMESISMVESVNRAGGHAQLTLLDGVGHNSWEFAYTHEPLFDWLLRQRKADPIHSGNADFADVCEFG